ncbi:MAG: hypothetical protein KBT03_00430 [Bacteroidales bacterium]|nr:hypothetical protein [Candidatus Scybalousia scybalohippi]
MALKSGRVGVKKTEVDYKGKIKGGSSDLGGLKFRVTPEGQAQYKTPNGEWVNFSSGSTSNELEIPIHLTPFYLNSSNKYDFDASDIVVSGWLDLSEFIGKKCIVYGFADENFFDRGRLAMADVLPSDTEKVTPSKISGISLYHSNKILMVDTSSSYTKDTYPVPITADKPILSVYVSSIKNLFDTANAVVKVVIF